MWSMTDDKVKLRLTTILCADVHGYSAHGYKRGKCWNTAPLP